MLAKTQQGMNGDGSKAGRMETAPVSETFYFLILRLLDIGQRLEIQ
jgi:hypothetical protein